LLPGYNLPPTNFPLGNFSNQFESFGAIWKVIESTTDQAKEKQERKKEQSPLPLEQNICHLF
jgi:hypothetical protein